MEKIHENMCFDVVFLYENIRTFLFTYVFLYFLHLVLTFTRNGLLCLTFCPPCSANSHRNSQSVIALQHNKCLNIRLLGCFAEESYATLKTLPHLLDYKIKMLKLLFKFLFLF